MPVRTILKLVGTALQFLWMSLGPGTPAVNNPSRDLAALNNWCLPHKTINSFFFEDPSVDESVIAAWRETTLYFRGKDVLTLPPKTEQVIVVQASQPEREFFNGVLHNATIKYQQMDSDKASGSKLCTALLAWITRLKQACNDQNIVRGRAFTLPFSDLSRHRRSGITPTCVTCNETDAVYEAAAAVAAKLRRQSGSRRGRPAKGQQAAAVPASFVKLACGHYVCPQCDEKAHPHQQQQAAAAVSSSAAILVAPPPKRHVVCDVCSVTYGRTLEHVQAAENRRNKVSSKQRPATAQDYSAGVRAVLPNDTVVDLTMSYLVCLHSPPLPILSRWVCWQLTNVCVRRCMCRVDPRLPTFLPKSLGSWPSCAVFARRDPPTRSSSFRSGRPRWTSWSGRCATTASTSRGWMAT